MSSDWEEGCVGVGLPELPTTTTNDAQGPKGHLTHHRKRREGGHEGVSGESEGRKEPGGPCHSRLQVVGGKQGCRHLTLRSRFRGFPTSGRVMSFLVPWLQAPKKKSAKTPCLLAFSGPNK